MKRITHIICSMIFLFILGNSCNQQNFDTEAPKGYPNVATLKLAYATGILKLVDVRPDIPENLTVYRDLVYKETKEKDLKVDIYHLNSISTPTPLLVFVHGGSWKKGDKDDYRRYLVDYAEKGYITATVSYRLTREAIFPAAFDDVVCAVKWLKTHSDKYHIDPDNIAVIGGSAGAHLAMMLAYHANDSSYHSQSGCACEADASVKAIVNLYGPVDLTTEYARNHPSVTQFIGSTYSDTSHALFQLASPLHYISPDDPPTLTFHGTLDELVPVSQADTLDNVLKAKQVPSYYHRLEGWPHTMDAGLKVNQYCQYHMDAFFEKYLQ